MIIGERHKKNAESVFTGLERIPRTRRFTIDFINAKNNFVVDATGTMPNTDLGMKIRDAMINTSKKEAGYLITEYELPGPPRVYVFLETPIFKKREDIDLNMIGKHVSDAGPLGQGIDGLVFRNLPTETDAGKYGGEVFVFYKDPKRVDEKDFNVSPEFMKI
ncbi:MAG: hypothetical protein LBE48_00925 [Methanomassiliicoccaceae archaeon]|jgi:hypothetical protein|nr:hypothetical protein [Methanomassiliicoccaceae archaeon]